MECQSSEANWFRTDGTKRFRSARRSKLGAARALSLPRHGGTGQMREQADTYADSQVSTAGRKRISILYHLRARSEPGWAFYRFCPGNPGRGCGPEPDAARSF